MRSNIPSEWRPGSSLRDWEGAGVQAFFSANGAPPSQPAASPQEEIAPDSPRAVSPFHCSDLTAFFLHRLFRRNSGFGRFDSARNTPTTNPAPAFKNHIAANLFAGVVDNRNALPALAAPDGP